MSKRELKKYTAQLTKPQLEEQFIQLYEKFKEVKVYYDFVFNPKENDLVKEAKLKISNEYFPVRGKRPKMRRSTAQKFIKQYIVLGVDPFLIADIMLYALEIALVYTSEKEINNEAFYKSSFNSYQQAIEYCLESGIFDDFKSRVVAIQKETEKQAWRNQIEFKFKIERFD